MKHNPGLSVGIRTKCQAKGRKSKNHEPMADRDNGQVSSVAVIAIVVLVLLVGIFMLRWWSGAVGGEAQESNDIDVQIPNPLDGGNQNGDQNPGGTYGQ